MDVRTRPRNWVATVQRFVRGPEVDEAEYCELCSLRIPPRHPHLVEPAKHRLLCVCQGCDTLLGDREDRHVRPCAPRNADARGFPLERRGMGCARHSDRPCVLLLQHPGKTHPRALSRSRGPHRVASDARRMVRDRRAQPCADRTPTRCRSPAGQSDQWRPRILRGADRPLLRAGRTDPHALARYSGR